MRFEEFLAKFPDAKIAGAGWKAKCPAHADGDPSLTLGKGSDGISLVTCHSGCSREAILNAMGLTIRDLMGNEEKETTTVIKTTPYEIRNLDGELVAIHLRQDLSNGKKRMPFKNPDGSWRVGQSSQQLPFFGMERLKDSSSRSVVVCEGEKPAAALQAARVLAVGSVTGGNGTPCDETLTPLLKFEKVVLWADNDEVGRKHMNRIAKRLLALGCLGEIEMVKWADAPEKGDAADFLASRSVAEAVALPREPWVDMGDDEAADDHRQDEAEAQLMERPNEPCDLGSEQAIISILLSDRAAKAQDQTLPFLVPDDFYNPQARDAYRVLSEILRDKGSADSVTLSARAAKLGIALEPAFLATCAAHVAELAHVPDYVKTVREKAALRVLAKHAAALVEITKDSTADAEMILNQTDALIASLRERAVSADDDGKMIIDFQREVTDDMLKRRAGEYTGLSTGLHSLDMATGGFQAGDYIVLAARPSQGKTAMALQIAQNVARHKTVAFFSIEMRGIKLIDRMICGRANMSLVDFKVGKPETGKLKDINRGDWDEWLKASTEVFSLPMFIDEHPLDPIRIKTKARRLKRKFGDDLGLIVVDYLQLMDPAADGKRDKNREKEVAECSRTLFRLAKELKVPILALAQLNRAYEARGSDRERKVEMRTPKMSDLRESGQIEQDADLMLFLFSAPLRDENGNTDGREDPASKILYIAKQRDGERDKPLAMDFDGIRQRFSDAVDAYPAGISSEDIEEAERVPF